MTIEHLVETSASTKLNINLFTVIEDLHCFLCPSKSAYTLKLHEYSRPSQFPMLITLNYTCVMRILKYNIAIDIYPQCHNKIMNVHREISWRMMH